MIFSTSLSMLKALTRIHPHPRPCTHISLDSKAPLPRHPWVGPVSLSINLSASLRSDCILQSIQHYITMVRSSSLHLPWCHRQRRQGRTPLPRVRRGFLAFIGKNKLKTQDEKHLEARRVTWFQVAGDLLWGLLPSSPKAHSRTVVNRKADATEWKTQLCSNFLKMCRWDQISNEDIHWEKKKSKVNSQLIMVLNHWQITILDFWLQFKHNLMYLL